MKTLKNTIVIAGIIVAIFSLTAHASERPAKEASAAEKSMILKSMGIDKNFETQLIEEYLEEQVEVIEQTTSKVVVYNSNDEPVFEGEANSSKAVLFMQSADFLIEYDQTAYYRLHN